MISTNKVVTLQERNFLFFTSFGKNLKTENEHIVYILTTQKVKNWCIQQIHTLRLNGQITCVNAFIISNLITYSLENLLMEF